MARFLPSGVEMSPRANHCATSSLCFSLPVPQCHTANVVAQGQGQWLLFFNGKATAQLMASGDSCLVMVSSLSSHHPCAPSDYSWKER